LALIFLVLGTLFMGIATPTEGGAMGAVGALVLAALKRRLNFKLLWEGMKQTTHLTSFVIFILIGSTIFALTFRAVDGDLWVEHLMTSIPGGIWGFLIVVNLIVFALGFFIDSFLTPPFGFALFYLKSVAPPSVTTMNIYRGVIPFIIIQVFMVVLAMAFPQTITFFMDKNHSEAFHDPNKSQLNQEISSEDALKLLEQGSSQGGDNYGSGGSAWDGPSAEPEPATPNNTN